MQSVISFDISVITLLSLYYHIQIDNIYDKLISCLYISEIIKDIDN